MGKRFAVLATALLALALAAPAGATAGEIPGTYRFNVLWNSGIVGGGRVTLRANGHGRIAGSKVTWSANGDAFTMTQTDGFAAPHYYEWDGTFTGTGFCTKAAQCPFIADGVQRGTWYGIKKS